MLCATFSLCKMRTSGILKYLDEKTLPHSLYYQTQNKVNYVLKITKRKELYKYSFYCLFILEKNCLRAS